MKWDIWLEMDPQGRGIYGQIYHILLILGRFNALIGSDIGNIVLVVIYVRH